MAQGTSTSYQAQFYQAQYGNNALLLGGLVVLISALVGAVALSLAIAATGNELIPMVLGSLGGFVALFVVLLFSVMRKHRWTLEPGGLLVEEKPLVPFTGRRRTARLGFGEIALLSRVQNGADDVIELQGRTGARFRMAPAALPGPGLRNMDVAGLEGFAVRLQRAIEAAGHPAPPVLDGMGFWNRAPGLAFIGVLLVLSLALAGVAVVGIFSGAEVRGSNGGQAAAIVVLLPVGVGWMLRRAWRRR